MSSSSKNPSTSSARSNESDRVGWIAVALVVAADVMLLATLFACAAIISTPERHASGDLWGFATALRTIGATVLALQVVLSGIWCFFSRRPLAAMVLLIATLILAACSWIVIRIMS